MNVWRQKTSIVSKLRVKGNGFDALATRLRFERLIGAADFLPAGLPPKAIVCIKNLRDPLPRTLQLSQPDLKHSDVWRNAVAKEIENLMRRAFRPVRESVPAQAESIVFADDSELLACLASDWSQGLLPERWWWRSLFPDLYQAQTIARIWIEAAEFAPSALQILARQGKAVKFVTALQPDETRNLLRQITLVFGLNSLQIALFEPFEKEKEFIAAPPENLIGKQFPPVESYFSDALQSLAPWFEFVPETRHPALSFERQCLLGIGLMLARAPRIARSPEFARQVKIFQSEFEINKATAQGGDKIPARKQKPRKRKEKIEEFSFLPEKPKSPTILRESKAKREKPSGKKASEILKDSSSATEKNIKSSGSSVNLESEASSRAKKARKSAGKFVFEDFSPEKIPDRGKSKKETKFYQAEKPITHQPVFGETADEFETEIEFIVETRFGGVFYLLNLGLYLNLYRDFSAWTEAEIDLNIWDFVSLLALEFLGGKIKKDAVWKLLEQLAGRETDEELGHGFAPPDEWRMPPEWLETFQTNQKWRWTKRGKRLIARHPAGFNVIDVESLDDAKSHLENELKIYGKDFSQVAESDSASFPEYSSPLENWLKNLSEYVRARLLQALNLQTQKQLNAILFERKATVAVAATNLDVTFNLADLPFAVRLAGLDRNPGWIPAAGKFVKFHFI